MKGEIAKGSDADFALIDINKDWTLSRNELETKTKETFLFDAWKVRGRCVSVILRGKTIMKDGVIVGTPGEGKFINTLE
jgi:dihydroorotase-like cyclic amidohydrolase